MKFLFLILFPAILVISCTNDDHLFKDCEFPYPTISYIDSSPEGIINEEDLPEKIVTQVRNKYENIEKILGAVFFHCTRQELLYIGILVHKRETMEQDNGEIIIIEYEEFYLDIYDNCGDLIGDARVINRKSEQDSYEEEIEQFLGEEVKIVHDVTIYNFLDNSIEYYVDVSLKNKVGQCHYIIDTQTGFYCEME